jgi:hypothetical protein
MNTKVEATEHGKNDSRKRDHYRWPEASPSASLAIGRLNPGQVTSVPGVPPGTWRFSASRDNLLLAFRHPGYVNDLTFSRA